MNLVALSSAHVKAYASTICLPQGEHQQIRGIRINPVQAPVQLGD